MILVLVEMNHLQMVLCSENIKKSLIAQIILIYTYDYKICKNNHIRIRTNKMKCNSFITNI